MFDLFTAAVLMTVLFLAITMADILTSRLITRQTRKKALVTCLLILLSSLGEYIGVATNGADPSLIPLHRAAKLVEFTLAPAIGVAVAAAYGDAAHLRAAALLTAAHGLFQCIALPFGGVFRVDAGNVYHRGPLFPVYAAALVLSILYGCVAALRGGRAYQTGMDSVLLLTLLMLTAGVGLLLVFPDIRIAYLCVSVGNTLLYMRHYKIMLQVDAVTGLLNRRCYDVNMADLGSQAVILLFDVDQFKQVNDTFGHSVGDICLQQVAGILRSIYGRYGLCYRIGGDEFAVIMRSGLGRTEILNRGFDSLIRKLREADGRMPGVSLGYARYDAGTSHIRDVIEEADAMLYRRKSEKARVSDS